MTIGEIIKVARLSHNWSLRKLGELSGVSDVTISALERGQTMDPGILVCKRLARAFGCGLEIFENAEDTNTPENHHTAVGP